MNESELLNLITTLYLSIYENNIQEAKRVIPILNENCKKESNFSFYVLLNENNPLGAFFPTKFIQNETCQYAIANLENIDIMPMLRYNNMISNLTISEDTDNIRNFIYSFLNDDNQLDYYKNQIDFNKIKLDMLKLCLQIKDYNLLNQVKNKKQE